MNVSCSNDSNPNTPSHCLRLPGRKLDLKALLKKKKFREPHGYKKGALAAFSELEQAGLGNTETSSSKFGTVSYIQSCNVNILIIYAYVTAY